MGVEVLDTREWVVPQLTAFHPAVKWTLPVGILHGHQGKVFVLVDQLMVSDDPCDHLSMEVPGQIVGAVHHLSMMHTH